VTRYENGEPKSRTVLRDQILHQLNENATEMASMLYRGHRFLGGIKHFWMAMKVWKTNLILEDLARQKRTKIGPK
jgi:hypothetical protein